MLKYPRGVIKMKEQTYQLKNQENFNLTHIFECGQCFRWEKQEENHYIGIVKNNVIEIKQKGKDIQFKSIGEDNLEKLVTNYFDLNRDYQKIQNQLKQTDESMENSIEYGKGIRLLNQELWETIISFIISANNNIPRIKGIIERLSKNFGKEIIYNQKKYYTFPTPEELKDVTIQQYRELGLGFRDKRVYETVQKILNNEVELEKLKQNSNTLEVREKLLEIPGVGPKVADCILLFSDLKRLEVFPIDVWVRRVMNELYIKQEDENKVSKKQIEELAKQKFGDVAGLAQQYLFYWRRES